jgi:2-polyprenyl-3-methyl-5-hydroxy-6-metoxy-1,4-benzoquinol methylase
VSGSLGREREPLVADDRGADAGGAVSVERPLARLVAEILKINVLQKTFLAQAVSALEDGERESLERYIHYALTEGLDYPYLARCYDQIVRDTLTEQIHFRREGRYRYSTYAEVEASVYRNDEYMAKYMHGLALTSFLWPNHSMMRRFFLEVLPRETMGAYLEIGPGHGFYMREAMRLSRFERFIGVDLSPESVRMTRRILASPLFGATRRASIEECDFLAGDPREQFQAAVMGEVLKHVEKPGSFLEKIREVVTPDAFVYVTTCIDAPARDHIHLFRNFAEIEDLVVKTGFRVANHRLVPHLGASLEEAARERLAINVAMSLAPVA